jgi:T-complex protein 1 subunit zeta
MSSVNFINEKGEELDREGALRMNLTAATSLSSVIRSNVGPKGTEKMLVGGAGQVKITKDGNVLLHEMSIIHPTAQMIARAATAQDDTVGDGSSSNVLFIGELFVQSFRYVQEGIHVSHLVDGIELAKKKSLEFLETCKYKPEKIDREFLLNVARTALRTKLPTKLADQMTEIVTDAVLTIKRDSGIDLHMVEIMHQKQKMSTDSKLIKGLVLDHGGRHPAMPKRLENCYILNCNVSLEYENTEVHSKLIYSNAEQRENLLKSEHKATDDLCKKIIDLKREVCDSEEGKKNNRHFVVINQKGIDPLSLDMLAREGILGLRRAKKRNAERLILACGGNAVNSFDDLSINDLGQADLIYEEQLDEEKYTYIEGVKNPQSCTILVRAASGYEIAQIKDAIRDGLRAVKNVFDDESAIPGAGAFEIACSEVLKQFAKSKEVEGKKYYGVNAFAEALLVIPKAVCENAGVDAQESIINALKSYDENKKLMGVDINDNGKPINPIDHGIYDNYCVKKSLVNISPVLTQQFLMVDEIIRAGKHAGKVDE